MSRQPVNEISHPVEAAVLDALHTQARPMNVAQLTKASGYGRTMASRHIARLVALGFLESAEVPLTPDTRRALGMGRVTRHWAISRTGSMALASHKRRLGVPDAVPTAPRADNLFARPLLTRTDAGYCRNDGNKHIASRGFSC